MTTQATQPAGSARATPPVGGRSWYAHAEEIWRSRRPRLAKPLVKAVAAAVIANPFAGRWQMDLSALAAPSAALGAELGRRAVALLGGRPVHSYGKGGIVGIPPASRST